MTTTVKIEAHCGGTKEVRVEIKDGDAIAEAFTLQDGEKAEKYVYDKRSITVAEFEK